MAKRQSFDLKALLRDGSESFKRRNANIEDLLAGVANPQQKRDRRAPLEQSTSDPPGMVHVPDKVHVRVVRYVPNQRHDQDDDNTVGGCKQLRDAIAALLCRKGDSEEDGFTWEYVTRKGPFAVEIEVYEKEEVKE